MPLLNMLHITLEIWGAVFSLICMGIIFLEIKTRDKPSIILAIMFLLNMILLGNDALAWGFRGNSSVVGWYIVRISNFFVFVLTPIIEGFVCMYFLAILTAPDQQSKLKWTRLIWSIVSLDVLFIIYSQFSDVLYYFDKNNIYHRAGNYWISMVFGDSIIFIFLLLIIIYHKYISKNMIYIYMLFIIVPVICALIQFFNYGISLNNLTFTICLIVLLFNWEFEKSKRYFNQEKMLMDSKLKLMQQKADIAEKDAQLFRKNLELKEMNTKITLTQIQPHFLYNTLTAISYLCDTEPETAKKAVDRFSAYLRMNLDNLQRDHLISFSKELEHVKTYLWIEKLRFGDMLDVKYDIRWKDFCIPGLTLQPLVENAVKHGICRTENGGMVKISVWKEEDKIYIKIKDEGAGFDVKKIYDDGKTHIGIENVKERLHILCNGTMEIESEPGKGTVVTMIIPYSE